MNQDSRQTLLKKIREAFAAANGEWVSRKRFLQESGLKDSDLFRHFAAWSEAVAAAGIDQRPCHIGGRLALADRTVDMPQVNPPTAAVSASFRLFPV